MMVSVDDIIATVAEVFGVAPADILSQSRRAAIVEARHAAMYLARTLLGASLPAIAQAFDKAHHATVLHAIRKIETRRTTCVDTAARLDRLEAVLLWGEAGRNDTVING